MCVVFFKTYSTGGIFGFHIYVGGNSFKRIKNINIVNTTQVKGFLVRLMMFVSVSVVEKALLVPTIEVVLLYTNTQN